MSIRSHIYIQILFAVKGKAYLIDASWEEKLYKFISGIIANKNQKLLAINGMPDHLHFLMEIKPSCSIPDLVREIKKCSHTYVTEQQLTKFPFQWQEGFAAFSYSHSAVDAVIKHINSQKQHHEKHSFKDEYLRLLQMTKTDVSEAYLYDSRTNYFKCIELNHVSIYQK
jgi:putative transposase